MDKSTVALVRCNTYNEEEVSCAIDTGINLLGKISSFIRPNEKIVVKPNVLSGANPSKGVTTHPSIFKAVAKLLISTGAEVSYGDSPSFRSSEWNMKKSGLKQVADELGLNLADFDNGRIVEHKEALLNKYFFIANGALDSDGIISLPRLKTHGFTRFTGAVKNQFGCIPGINKGQFHVKMPDPYKFGTMLVDINTLVRPRLFIMDGIMAMEGNGPANGTLKKLGVLLFSSDPVALDSVACKIIDLDPEYVPTSKPGEMSGLGTYHYGNIDLIGESIEAFIDKDFDVIRHPPAPSPGSAITKVFKNRVCPKPVIQKQKCINCGTCINLCPVEPKAVDHHDGNKSEIPTHKYGRCIRCYCCQEVCPEGAIEIKKPLLGKIFFPRS